MIALKDVGNIQQLLDNSPLSTTKMWWQDVTKILPIQIIAFVKRMKIYGFEQEAKRNFGAVLREIQKAIHRGELPDDLPILDTRFSPKRITSGDFRRLLTLLPFVRRKAVLFALECRLDPDKVSIMTWKDLDKESVKKRMTDTAHLIRQSLPRGLFTDYLFWEFVEGAHVQPLYGLKQEIADLTCGMEWEEFLDVYHTMIPYDEQAEFLTEG